MQWFMRFGQIASGVFGVISVLWMIIGGFLLVLKLLAREDELDSQP
jgi:hypothetical protein